MRATLANLEKEEAAIVEDYNEGTKHGHSMREHLNNIRKHALYEACDCKNFEEYVKAERLPISHTHAKRLALCGEVEGYLEKAHARAFSERALEKLSTVRVEVENDDGEIQRTRQIDANKVRKVARALRGEKDVTAPMVAAAIEKVIGEKPVKTWSKQLESKIKSELRWLVSAQQLDEDVWLDADLQLPGVAKRLAKVHSDIASFLRRVSK